MFKRFARNLKIENAIANIDDMLDDIMEIQTEFQEDRQSNPSSEFQYGNIFQQNTSSVSQALKAISEAEKQLNIARNIFLKQGR
jgi:hypothetical protein